MDQTCFLCLGMDFRGRPVTPLFEVERHFGLLALGKKTLCPIGMHRAGMWPAFSAGNDPIDWVKTSGAEPRRQVDGPEERFTRKKPNSSFVLEEEGKT